MIKIKQFNQNDGDFWQLMGCWFASASLKRSLGIAMSSDEKHVWLLAFNKKELVGFCAVVPGKKGSALKYLCALAEEELSVVFPALLLKVIELFGSSELRAVVSKEELPFYQKQGFEITKNRGSYFHLKR